MNEFERIASCFAPLARTPEARGLEDDVAEISGTGLLVTADAIVEGVHFLPADPIELVAKKALRVNVSDIVAKGAAPTSYLVTLAWPKGRPGEHLEGFARGLGEDQALFGCALLGGDTTMTPGPLTVAITMIGRPLGRALTRAGARAGDDVWVSGTIGDAVLGLDVLREELDLSDQDREFLARRYRLPEPRAALAGAVARYATASMDVSDGLLGDAEKLARASGVRLVIDPNCIPLSDAARRWLDRSKDRTVALNRLASGGDDYEILFTAAPEHRVALVEAATDGGVALTRIGAAVAGEGVDAGGLAVAGYVHAFEA